MLFKFEHQPQPIAYVSPTSAFVDNEVTNPLASAVRGERERKFMAVVSAVINHFELRVSDMLYSFGQCVATLLILHRHCATLEDADLIEVLCSKMRCSLGGVFRSATHMLL